MARLFISQERLDLWSFEDKAILDNDHLTLTDLNRTFVVKPAVRFLSVSGDEDDSHGFLNKVKTEDELSKLGADVYMDSVIHGDVAYDVQPGFVGPVLSRR